MSFLNQSNKNGQIGLERRILVSVYVSLEKMAKSLKTTRKIRFFHRFLKFEQVSNNITSVSAPKFLPKRWKTKMIQSKGQLLTIHDSFDHFSSKRAKFMRNHLCKIAQNHDFLTKFAKFSKTFGRQTAAPSMMKFCIK